MECVLDGVRQAAAHAITTLLAAVLLAGAILTAIGAETAVVGSLVDTVEDGLRHGRNAFAVTPAGAASDNAGRLSTAACLHLASQLPSSSTVGWIENRGATTDARTGSMTAIGVALDRGALEIFDPDRTTTSGRLIGATLAEDAFPTADASSAATTAPFGSGGRPREVLPATDRTGLVAGRTAVLSTVTPTAVDLCVFEYASPPGRSIDVSEARRAVTVAFARTDVRIERLTRTEPPATDPVDAYASRVTRWGWALVAAVAAVLLGGVIALERLETALWRSLSRGQWPASAVWLTTRLHVIVVLATGGAAMALPSASSCCVYVAARALLASLAVAGLVAALLGVLGTVISRDDDLRAG
jgi:hypothetical protein